MQVVKIFDLEVSVQEFILYIIYGKNSIELCTPKIRSPTDICYSGKTCTCYPKIKKWNVWYYIRSTGTI
jgi:hypothetical protein